MAKTNRKKSSSQSSGRKKKKKSGRGIFRKLLLVLVLLVLIGGAAWYFRDAFGAFADQVRYRLGETRKKLPTVTITPAPASPVAESSASSTPPRVQEQLIGRIVELTEKHFHDPELSVEEIGRELSYHPKYISRVFKEKMGV